MAPQVTPLDQTQKKPPKTPGAPQESAFAQALQEIQVNTRGTRLFTGEDDEEKRRDSQNVFQNTVDDIGDFVGGLVSMYKDAAIPSAVYILNNLDWLGKIEGQDVLDNVSETGSEMLKGVIDSFEKWEDPAKALHNHPFESLLDLSLFTAATGALGKFGTRTFRKGVGTTVRAPFRKPTIAIPKTPSQVGVEAATFSPEFLKSLLDRNPKAVAETMKQLNKFDLERTFDMVGKFPFGLLGEVVSKKLIKPLRERSDAVNRVAGFIGVGKEANAVNQLYADKFLKAQVIANRRFYVDSIKPLGKLGLTAEESSIAMLRGVGLDDFTKVNWARGIPENPKLGQALSRVANSYRVELRELLGKALTPEREALVKQGVELYKRTVKMRETDLRRAGFGNPEQFKNAEIRFLFESIDAELKSQTGRGIIEVMESIAVDKLDDMTFFLRGLTGKAPKVTKGEAMNTFYELMSKFDIHPTYFPILEILRDSRVAIAVQELERRLFRPSQARPGATVSRLETAEAIPTLRDLIKKRDPVTKKPIFVTDLQEAAAQLTIQTNEFLAQASFLKAIAKQPWARELRFEKELKKGEEFFTPDIYLKYLDTTMFARRVLLDEMKRIGIKDITGDGMLAAWGSAKEKIIGKMVDDLAKLPKDVRLFAIPKGAANNIARFMKPVNPLVGILWDTPQGIWKTLVLLYSPGWYAANAVGNVILMSMAGVSPFGFLYNTVVMRRLRRLMPEQFRAGIVDDTTNQIRKVAAKSGRSDLQKLADASPVGVVARGVGGMNQMLSKFNNGIEILSKAGAFLSFAKRRVKDLRKTGNSAAKMIKGSPILGVLKAEEVLKFVQARPALLKKVINDVNEFLFDYYRLHPWERQYFRRFFPFWTWIRNTNILVGKAVKQGFDKPLKSFAVQRLAKVAFDMINEDEYPEWMRGMIPIGGDIDDGGIIFLNLRRYNPFFGVADFFDPTNLDKILTNVNPFVKIFIERRAGKNLFTGKPFTDKSLVFYWGGRVLRHKGNGRFTDKPFLPTLYTHLAKNSGPVNYLDMIINPFLQTDDGFLLSPDPIRDIDGTPKYEREWWIGFSKWVGIPLFKMDKEKLTRIKRSKIIALDRQIRTIKQLLKSRPPDEHPMLFNALKDILSDRRDWFEVEE